MEKTIIDYLLIVRKKLWWIALFVMLSCAVTFYVSQAFVLPVYEANSKLLVNSVDKTADAIDLNNVTMNLSLVESYKAIIKSNKIVDEVAAAHPEFALTPEKLAKKLKISSIDKTQIITIAVEDPDYGRAVAIANAVATTFIADIPSLMNMNNVTMLSPADPDKRPQPVNASMALNLAISFLLSLMAALGAVFFLENINDTIRSEKEAEFYVGLPVLASIGAIKELDVPRRMRVASREAGEQAYVAVK